MECLGEKCAVFGVFGEGLDVARLAFFGLYALQHRGQESAGIAAGNGDSICLHKGMGLVSQVFNEEVMNSLKGFVAIGHNRYSTAGGSKVKHAQPMLAAGASMLEHIQYADANPSLHDSVSLCSTEGDGAIALAHNGNLPSTTALEEYLEKKGIARDEYSDSRMIVEALGAHMREGHSLEEAAVAIYPLLTGAFSLVVMSADTLIAMRDRCGIRPLSIGRLNGGYIVASETCAFSPIGATHERDVEPGELVVITKAGIVSKKLEEPEQKLDIFEFVYFARPDSHLLGKSVYQVRHSFGEELAAETDIKADVIIPVPETAIPSAIGYSQKSGIPMELGLTKNRYIHRTFIEPEQHIREQGVRSKLTPVPEVIAGRRVIVIDDSIVRGTTSQQIVKMLFDAGAKEVHFLSSSPPVKYPDFYGIDTPKQEKLIAATKSIPEMRDFLGATSLHFLSYEGLMRATGLDESLFCTACFTGEYPIDIRERAKEVSKV